VENDFVIAKMRVKILLATVAECGKGEGAGTLPGRLYPILSGLWEITRIFPGRVFSQSHSYQFFSVLSLVIGSLA